jgi:hypothetical protein
MVSNGIAKFLDIFFDRCWHIPMCLKLIFYKNMQEKPITAKPQKKTPLFPPFARGDTGGCINTFLNLSSRKWGKEVFSR